MNKTPLVLKMGGRLLEDMQALDALLTVIKGLAAEYPLVLVHGGGAQVDSWLATFGFTTEKIDGQRVSPPAQMPVIAGALAGAVNGLMVARAQLAGLNAVGLTLAAGHSLKFDINHQLGAVGIAKANDGTLVNTLLHSGFVPVFSSIGQSDDGQLLNVNADIAAAAICQLVGGTLVLLTDVPGILDSEGKLIGSDQVTLAPITFTWAINELLPALVLLGLAVVGIYWTIVSRNKEENA